jgi:acyl-CoA thioesterase-1
MVTVACCVAAAASPGAASALHDPVKAPAPLSARAAHRTILVVGDSLSAEYGLARGSGWVQLLSERLAADGNQYSVVNASISGDTTRGGRTRLAALLREPPAVVVLELGANDGLRGLSVDAMRDNLQAMVDACRKAGARVLLVGIRVPPNYGDAYAQQFYAVYTTLAQRNRVGLAPFLLDGFADQLELFQADHIHPLAIAQGRMLDNVWPHLKPLLRP